MPSYSDNYDDAPDATPEGGGGGGGDDDKDKMEGGSAVLPKSVFKGDVKPGDYIRLCVDKVDDDSVLCHRDDDSGKREKTEEPAAQPPESPQDGSTASMMD